TFGYALGYLGGGLLLAVNIAMIFTLGNDLGTRLSFVTVAVWWLVFSIPLLRRVPEPPAKVVAAGVGIVSMTFNRLRETFRHLRRYRELLKYLVAFLIYNDGIGTIIGVAAIYGAELGFGAIELIAAILLVQFVGIPFAIIFGRIPSPDEPRRAVFLAFVLWNLVMLPLVGIGARLLLPAEVVGTRPAPYETVDAAVGEGSYDVDEGVVRLEGEWELRPAAGLPTSHPYAFTSEVGARYEVAFNGGRTRISYAEGPDRSIWEVHLDGAPLVVDGEAMVVDAYNPTERFDVELEVEAPEPGRHVLALVNTAERNPASTGTVMAIGPTTVLPPARPSSLPTILALLFVVEVVGLALAFALGSVLCGRLAAKMTTKSTIILALVVYAAIAVWGFFLDTVVEFWFLAFMVAVVQGGSQALSRSLYASLSPTSESGEFFGFFTVMSKFSAIVGPAVFAAAVAAFGSSRPAIASIALFFVVGIVLLARVDVEEGRRVAIEADLAAAAAGEIARD
ncbi:MAG TPA: MFS transporter, partial [Actinobacteria bacterium]|nr:MFS transporter [Actinomycetota bacterium]